jgi:hypothetical protein
MRRTTCFMLAAIAVACAGSAAHAAPAARTATCTSGTAAVIASASVCLKAGQACKAGDESSYEHYGFMCVKLKLVKKAASTPKPTAAAAPGSTEKSPIPLGTSAPLPNGWTLTINSVNIDAGAIIAAANPNNVNPPAGFTDVLVSITATYTGTGTSFFQPGYTLRATGASKTVYTTFGSLCGIAPTPNLYVTQPQTSTGGTISGIAACYFMPTYDASTLALFAEPPPTSHPKVTWFATH